MKKKIYTNLQNVSYLSFIQILNYLAPLFILPYAFRVFGPEKYGVIVFYQSITASMGLFINYGYNYIGVNYVNKKNTNEVYWGIFIAKFLLFFVLVLFYIIFVEFTVSESLIKLIAYASLGLPIYQLLLPLWYFQGKNKLNIIVICNLLSKVLYIALIYILLKKSDDFYFMPLANSFSLSILGVVLFFISTRNVSSLKKNFNGAIKLIPLLFSEATPLFISNFFVTFVSNVNNIILGIYSGDLALGIFGAGAKLIDVFRSLIVMPITQAFFPKAKELAEKNELEMLFFRKKIIKVSLFIAFIVTTVIFVYGETTVILFAGSKYLISAQIIKWFSLLPLLWILETLLGPFGLIITGKKFRYIKAIIVASLSVVVFNIILVPIYSEVGTIIAWNSSILVLIILEYFYLRKVLGIHLV